MGERARVIIHGDNIDDIINKLNSDDNFSNVQKDEAFSVVYCYLKNDDRIFYRNIKECLGDIKYHAMICTDDGEAEAYNSDEYYIDVFRGEG